MRLLLTLITIILSSSVYADVYNDKGNFVGKEYNSNKSSLAHVAINTVGILLSKESKNREEIQKLYQKKMKEDSNIIKDNICNEECKAQVQAQLFKKYKINKHYQQ